MSGIYEAICKKQSYDEEIQDCIENTVQKLINNDTTVQKPGMLLGNIQSGKTRTFIGIAALAFDKGYNFIVVLTKGTKALAKQTYERLYIEFEEFIEDDLVKIYDVMNIPGELTPYIRNQKIIIVAKKETNNLDRIVGLFEKYEDLKNKKVLIIDDEADYASIGFKKDKSQVDEISVNTLAKKINKIRAYGTTTDYLQVTATPYSLYLQPEQMQVNGDEYFPFRPAFTELVPIHDKYIGSKFYFEESEDPASPAFYLHIDVPEKELEVLRKRDQRYISNILKSPNLEIFRFSILNFIVGGTIRRIQESPKNYKCSCIIHTEISREKHSWQYDLVSGLLTELTNIASNDPNSLKELTKKSYENLSLSINQEYIPTFTDVFSFVVNALINGCVGIKKINSEEQVEALLDRKGQLRLDNPFNIFIGGQILDRGITIENMICFFYGRNPKKFQQDTVLQHSRMYGARTERDISVTRFYTSMHIYNAMKKMHQFDSGLREAFENGQHGQDGVVFLEVDESGVINSCAPNKILISSTETIRPFRRLLPRGMQTVSKTKMVNIDSKINLILSKYPWVSDRPILIDIQDACSILRLINESYEFSSKWNNNAYAWDVNINIAIINRLCKGHVEPNSNEKIYCIIRKGRNASRLKGNYTFNDAPDDGQIDRPLAKATATTLPILQLFRQTGKESNGWRGVEFWWPVLVCPENTKTSVFAAETI
ncbi:Z1 domain-containing protein [Legionella pneumophila serogroup 1]